MARLLVLDLAAIDVTRIGAPSAVPSSWGDLGTAEAALLVAPIVSEGIALGAFQRPRSTIDLQKLEGTGLSLVRRATGGTAIRVGRGQIYVSLTLRRPEALDGVADPGRALNRHVRPLLRALSSLGDEPAASGGRDMVVMGGAPIAWVGIGHERVTGRTVLEAVVAVDTSFAIAPELDLAHGAIAPRWLGRAPTTLSEKLPRKPPLEVVVRAVQSAYEAAAGGDTTRIEAGTLPATRVNPDQPAFSAMVEEAIGLLGAIVERDRIALGGDWMASRDVVDALGSTLFALGPDASDEELGHAIDGAFGDARALLLGVRSLPSIAKLVRGAWDATKKTARG